MVIWIIGHIEDQGESEALLEMLNFGDFHHFFIDRESVVCSSGRPKPDLILSLGSDWSLLSMKTRRLIRAELLLVRTEILRGVPYFGICFGAQILSLLFGGRISRLKTAEIGWKSIGWSESFAVDVERWMQWHYDCFSVPPGFELLARNDVCAQGIRSGRSLGVQFHPEVNESIVSRWIEDGGAAELAAVAICPSAILEETRRLVPVTRLATHKLTEWFLGDVAQGPTTLNSINQVTRHKL